MTPPLVLVLDDTIANASHEDHRSFLAQTKGGRFECAFHDAREKRGYTVKAALAWEKATSGRRPDLILLDIQFGACDRLGLEILAALNRRRDSPPVRMLTRFLDPDLTQRCVALGAGMIPKHRGRPDALKLLIELALGLDFELEGLVGNSAAMRRLRQDIMRVACLGGKPSVLVQGESGAGKTETARAIHRQGSRSKQPFLVINCASVADTLLETELFGHEKGAFTGAIAAKNGKLEAANGGIVFLDNLDTMSPAMQQKLLEAVNMGRAPRVGGTKDEEFDVQFISACNRDLDEMIDRGEFRADLRYRLSIFTLDVPPLRDRKEDIPAIVDHAMQKLLDEYTLIRALTPDALRRLQEHDWVRNNVRELVNALEAACIRAGSGAIGAEHLRLTASKAARPSPEPARLLAHGFDLDRHQAHQAIRAMELALERTGGNLSAARQLLFPRGDPNHLRRRATALGREYPELLADAPRIRDQLDHWRRLTRRPKRGRPSQ